LGISSILRKLWTSPPSDNFAALKVKLNPKGDWDYSLESVLKSRKHMNAQYLIDRWERYWRVIESRHKDNSKQYFYFERKTVLELGCGPVFGWGPVAIFRGAEFYYYHEPSLLREVAESDALKDQYFFPLYQELRANFGDRMEFDVFHERVITRCQPVDFAEKTSVDIVLSNSVLEHIPNKEMRSLLGDICSVSNPGAHYLHSVDFGSHNIGGTGFGTLYKTDRSQGFKHLNRLRKSEIEDLLSTSGYTPLNATVYRTGLVNRTTMDAFWHDYSESDLRARVVFFVGKKAG
jgi:SAM-dependent methyltransferase